MSNRKPKMSQVTNPSIPQAAMVTDASTKQKKELKKSKSDTEGLNDSTQCTI